MRDAFSMLSIGIGIVTLVIVAALLPERLLALSLVGVCLIGVGATHITKK